MSQQQLDWSDVIEVTNEKLLNTEFSEFSPSYFDDKLLYVKNRPRQKLLDKKHNEPYFDLYYAIPGKANFLSAGESMGSKINTKYHEGPATIDKARGVMYFTRVDYNGSEFNLNKDKVATLKIFQTNFVGGSWSDPEKVEFNTKNEASCHPSISKDGGSMVFASDREGGYGKMDLYITHNTQGKWATPVNLGPEINTKENDWFPYINERGWLFYSSEGKGKNLDLFICKEANNGWSEPTILPYPINTKYDDFGFILSKSGTDGYFSSNRPGGAGKDDIYNFNSLKPIYLLADSSYNLLSLEISDSENKSPIQNALIKHTKIDDAELLNFDSQIFDLTSYEYLDSLFSDKNGLAEFRLNEGYSIITVISEGKKPWNKVLYNNGGQQSISVQLENEITSTQSQPEIVYVEKIIQQPQKINNVKVDVGAIIVLENIYYDYNSFELTQGAKKELDQLVRLMQENPKLKIQLSAHTDSRGKTQYNLDLSQKRAQSAKFYLQTKGILTQNIVAKGFGESLLRNHCADNVKCSEAEHIYNRRTEVKILEK